MPNCESELNKEIGERLQRIREGLGCTQEDFAEAIGVSVNYYRKLEYGQNALTIARLVSLKKQKEVDLNFLLTGERSKFNLKEYLATVEPETRKTLVHETVEYLMDLGDKKKE